MVKKEYILDGYRFASESEYKRAKKEKETIAYVTANTDSADMKALLKLYNRSIDKNAFQTIIGQQFLHNIRRRLIGSRIVSEETLAPIPVVSQQVQVVRSDKSADQKKMQTYKAAYENLAANQKIKNILIAVLIAMILAMFVITYFSKYSVFTYFTDYKTQIRNEVVDEMETWQKQLDEKEKDLQQREEKLAK